MYCSNKFHNEESRNKCQQVIWLKMLSKIRTLACHVHCLPRAQQKTEGGNLKKNIPPSPAKNVACSLIHRWGKQANWVLWPTTVHCLPQGGTLAELLWVPGTTFACSLSHTANSSFCAAASEMEYHWSTSWGAAAGSYYSQWCIQRQWNMLCSIHLRICFALFT